MVRRALMMAASLVLTASACAAVRAATDPGSVYGRAATNRAIAHRTAAALLAELRPPGGATPTGDVGHRLTVPGVDEVTPNLIDAHRWYRTPAPPNRAVAQVARHLPSGIEPSGGGSESGPGIVERDWQLRPVAGLRQRVVAVSATALPGGGTLVRLDGEAVWLSPRDPAERISSAIRSATFVGHGETVHGEAAASSEPHRLGPAGARRLAAAIDADELVQPGAVSCPVAVDEQIAVRFDGADHQVLARATESPTGCPSVSLRIAGQRPVTLADGVPSGRSLTDVLMAVGAITTCRAAQLAAVRATGGANVLLVSVRNRSPIICALRGVPRLTLVAGDGRTVNGGTRRARGAAVIVFPGRTARFTAAYTPCPHAAPARQARIGLPDVGATIVDPVASRVTPCPHDALVVSALAPAY